MFEFKRIIVYRYTGNDKITWLCVLYQLNNSNSSQVSKQIIVENLSTICIIHEKARCPQSRNRIVVFGWNFALHR